MYRVGRRILASGALLLGLSVGAGADYLDGNTLAAACQTNRQLVLAYAAGIADRSAQGWFAVNEFKRGLLLKQGLTNAHRVELDAELDSVLVQFKGDHCVRGEVSLGRIGDAFCRYLIDNPKERDQGASVLFNRAMKDTWPCR